jgi:hypothetical protein
MECKGIAFISKHNIFNAIFSNLTQELTLNHKNNIKSILKFTLLIDH